MTKVSKCPKCAVDRWFDDTLKAPEAYAKASKKEFGFWREDLSKLSHTSDRCKNFQNTKEFMVNTTVVQIEQPKVEESPKVKTMDVVDFAEPALRKEIQIILKNLKIVEEEVIKFIGTDARGDKVGMWMKLVEAMKKE